MGPIAIEIDMPCISMPIPDLCITIGTIFNFDVDAQYEQYLFFLTLRQRGYRSKVMLMAGTLASLSHS